MIHPLFFDHDIRGFRVQDDAVENGAELARDFLVRQQDPAGRGEGLRIEELESPLLLDADFFAGSHSLVDAVAKLWRQLHEWECLRHAESGRVREW